MKWQGAPTIVSATRSFRPSVRTASGSRAGALAPAAAFGPLIAGYLYDVTGSYGDAFALSAGLNPAAACLVLLLRKPAPP